jgi:hypothetical protein
MQKMSNEATVFDTRRTRVARWFVFKPKVPILVKFGGPWNGKMFFEKIFYDHLEYVTL